ncbi:hypothetical protein PVL29_009432 [Vitis rotundifolia]|uniref:Uncharacterized protein n=1 Tax=Vitis rotundifolia TaxID=103349 RepID=A0AA39DW16_VITRO|nr:hypothetical protein PVL29_009432 [Vitis rotundifolia]
MVQLLLSEPNWSDGGDEDSVKLRISLLNKLESIICSLISSRARSEARLWLCNTIAGISSIMPRHQRDLFVDLFRSKPWKRGLAAQLWQMIFEKMPHKAGKIIAKKSYMLENFFKGNPMRIMHWFSNFSTGGGLETRKGAKALSQFAFVNRDICWEELEWKGKHGQSPAMVATKPHYFLDLDVQRTFAESLKDGEILSIDRKFFVDVFVDLMYREDSRSVWEAIDEFLMEESFSSLCQHLLIVIEEPDFCLFLELIHKYINPKMEHKDFGHSSCWLEIILSKCSHFESIDHILLLNAVINQGRQLLRLIHDEDTQEEQAKIKDVVLQMCTISSNANGLAPILKCFKTKTIEVIKWLGLQSWVLHYRLSEECLTPDFHKSDKYALLHDDGFAEENGSDLDDRTSIRARRKKKEKSRKKRKKNFDHDDIYENELLDFGTSSDRLGLGSHTGSWLLSTDGYSTSWSSVSFSLRKAMKSYLLNYFFLILSCVIVSLFCA